MTHTNEINNLGVHSLSLVQIITMLQTTLYM